jgi:hypothetical protein
MTDFTHIVGTDNLFTDGKRTYEGHRCETCEGLGWRRDSKNPGPNGAWPRIHCKNCDNYGLTFEPCGEEYA